MRDTRAPAAGMSLGSPAIRPRNRGKLRIVDPRHVREFTRRNWSAVHEAKAEYWAQRYREKGWYANWKLAQESWAYAKRVRPDLPTEDDRAEDFAHHLELKALLDRAAHGFASR